MTKLPDPRDLLLSLTLIISAKTWADDEFPIELTCEMGHELVYIHLEETVEESWLRHHEASFFVNPWNISEYGAEEVEFKEIVYEPTRIKLQTKRRSSGTIVGDILISRLTLRFAVRGMDMTNMQREGQCYKGFKEYEKQI